jgi:hypothetical protein
MNRKEEMVIFLTGALIILSFFDLLLAVVKVFLLIK